MAEKDMKLSEIPEEVTEDGLKIYGHASYETQVAIEASQKEYWDYTSTLETAEREDEGRQWLDFLKGLGCIPADYGQEGWLFLMGFSTHRPDALEPIPWLKTLETARLAIRRMCAGQIDAKQLSVQRMNELAALCFTKDVQPLSLAKPRREVSSDWDAIDNFFPTVSDHFRPAPEAQ